MQQNKIKRILYFIIVNSAFAVCLYFALFKNIKGAQNIVKFYIWFQFATGIIALACVRQIKKVKRVIPIVLDLGFDVLVLIALIYMGWAGYGVLYLVGVFGITTIYEDAKNEENVTKPKIIKEKDKISKYDYISK